MDSEWTILHSELSTAEEDGRHLGRHQVHRREVVRLQQIEQPDILLAIDIGIDLFHWLLYFREYVHD